MNVPPNKTLKHGTVSRQGKMKLERQQIHAMKLTLLHRKEPTVRQRRLCVNIYMAYLGRSESQLLAADNENKRAHFLVHSRAVASYRGRSVL